MMAQSCGEVYSIIPSAPAPCCMIGVVWLEGAMEGP